jgi:hypothetical protein
LCRILLYCSEARLSNARDLSLPVNFEMTIAPKWTDYEEYLDDLSLPMKYTWTYRMVKEIGENERFLFGTSSL